MRKYFYSALCLAVVTLSCLLFPAITTAQNLNLSLEEVSFRTKDGVTISASWIIPTDERSHKKSSKFPVVILLHDYGLNRRDWGVFIPDLVQNGFGVLAPDLRGHGQSRGDGAVAAPSVENLLKTGIVDVEAALRWVKSQKRANAKRVALIGVGVGGDIAYLCSGVLKKKIRTSVVISPSDILVTGGEFINLEAQSVLFCVSSASQGGLTMIAAETLEKFTKDPKKLIIYRGDSHGFALFYKHPDLKHVILDWLNFLKRS